MIELLELKFSRRWQTNKIESDWSNSPRHSSSRQLLRSPRIDEYNSRKNVHVIDISKMEILSGFAVLRK